MKTSLLGGVICGLVLLMGCGEVSTKEKDFYSYSRIYDLWRIPLIEPLELISPNEGFAWFFQPPFKLQTRGAVQSIGDVKRVGVSSPIVVIYVPKITVHAQRSEAWFVLDVDKKQDLVFITEAEYQQHLQKIDKASLQLWDVNELFKPFDQGKPLPFSPNPIEPPAP